MRYLDIDTTNRISKIGLGTWQFGSPEWGYGETYARRDARNIVQRAVQLGVTLFDTAEIYGSGRSEQILGQALGENKNAVFIATKLLPLLPVAAVVRQRARASARRLRAARLNLYQVHRPNPLFGDGSLMAAMRSLQRAGLVEEVGVSSYSLARWQNTERALGGRILANQVSYSLLDRSLESDLLPFAAERGRIVIAYSPLARGLLSGCYHEGRRPADAVRATDRLFHPDSVGRTRELIATLEDVGAAHAATPAQIALAWTIHQPCVAAIPGASSVRQLEENAAAAEIDLADDEYAALGQASARVHPAPDPERPFRRKLAQVQHIPGTVTSLTATMWQDYQAAHRRTAGASADRC